MVTIRNVAVKAGVSVATVSNVITGKKRVRPETVERVKEAIRELNYSQSSAARDLAIGRSRIVGFVISDIQNPFFPEIVRGFQDQALAHQMDTVIMNTNYDPHRALTFVNRLLGLRVPGVAVLTSEIDPSVIATLFEHEVCAVFLDHGRVGPLTSNIVIDYAKGIKEAVTHLRQLGHEDIGFIGGPQELKSAQIRKQVFLEQVPDSRPQNILDADFTVKGGYFACSKLLSRTPPTAILAANDVMAIGAAHCAYDRGISIPGQLSIVGFDDIPFAEVTQPPLTTVAIPRRKVGEVAFQALSEMMTAAKDRSGREFGLGTHLVVRGSTGPAPEK
jgi:DNA-binding LacI/PurR family transcriptional regulator